MKLPHERLKYWREISRITREEVAEAFKESAKTSIGTSYQAVKNLEDGTTQLKMEHLLILKNRWNLNPNWITDGDGEMLIQLTGIVNEAEMDESYGQQTDVTVLIDQLVGWNGSAEYQENVKRVKGEVNKLLQERDKLKSKIIWMQEELMKLYKKV